MTCPPSHSFCAGDEECVRKYGTIVPVSEELIEDLRILGANCRAGCKTKDHKSWGECAREANTRLGPLR